jgi:thiamine biosynthesis lipoprotein
MGTMFTIVLYSPGKPAAEAAVKAAFSRIVALDNIMSDYQADSELMRLCDSPRGKPVRVSEELFDVLTKAQHISAISDGAFDVTVGPLVRLWRFSRKRHVLPSPAEIESARAAVGFKKLRLDRKSCTATLLVPGMRLDLGGIAKGYAADQALAVLKGRGLNRALVAASGDIALNDPPPGQRGWKIDIASMNAASTNSLRSVLLHNAGISTSGDADQYIDINGVRYSHIVNPATGLGLTNRIQVTVIAPNATASDALATTLCVLGPQRGLKLANFLHHTAALITAKQDGRDRVFATANSNRLLCPE